MTPAPTRAETLLTELYAIDPDLQQHHAALLPVIEELLKQKPDVTPSKAFVEKLRTQLLAQAKEQRATPATAPAATAVPRASFFQFFRGPILAPALALLIIAGAAGYTLSSEQSQHPQFNASSPGRSKLFAFNVAKIRDNAFGDLGTTLPSAPSVAYGRGGGGQADNHAPLATRSDRVGKMMIAQTAPHIAYVFSGALNLPAEQTVSVLKRQKNTRLPFEALGAAFDLGMLDLSSFTGRSVDTVTLTQDKEFGYIITLALGEGTVSISPNWPAWPHPETQCRDEACFRRMQLNPEDVPDDATIISLARTFATAHRIDLSRYGEPVVDTQWKHDYQAAADKSTAWVPDTLRVIFPQQIEGKTVVDANGNPMGLSMGVNVRNRRVADVTSLTNQQYIRSDYAAVKDPAQILAYLKQLDSSTPVDLPPGTTGSQYTVSLGTPTLGYAVFNRTDEQGATEELLIPSLLFPIQNAIEDLPIWRHTIAVPLAADLLNRLAAEPQPQVMPLDTPVTNSGAVKKAE